MMVLVSTTPAFCQDDTMPNEVSIDDTLVYVPEYLMQSLMDDLDQCDLDRIELKKTKAELALLYIDIAKQTSTINSLKKELNNVREERDTIESRNLQMAIDHGKELKKMKRKRNFWAISTWGAVIGAFGVHYNWKESWIEVK